MNVVSCNATIEVSSRRLMCDKVEEHGDGTWDRHSAKFGEVGQIFWSDNDLGSKPHTPPRYRVRESKAAWSVIAPDGRTVSIFYRDHPGHPHPQGAAEAEAARLNGESEPFTSEWLGWVPSSGERALASITMKEYQALLKVVEVAEEVSGWEVVTAGDGLPSIQRSHLGRAIDNLRKVQVEETLYNEQRLGEGRSD